MKCPKCGYEFPAPQQAAAGSARWRGVTPNTKHTPGPWTVGEQHRIESPTPGGGCIVVVQERSIGDYRDRKLICAAPELLEALKLGMRAMRSLGWDEAPESGPGAQLRQWFEQARAAIAKAEAK